MTVIALLSAKGAPGVTTTAMLIAALWPREVLLVDADPEGGDVALRLRREDGAPVDRSRGMLSLLALARREVDPSVLSDHAQTLRGGTRAVAGLTGPEQAGAAGSLWDNLGRCFADTRDRDVVVDCGRLAAGSVHLSLAAQANLVVGVLRPTVSQVVHTRERLASLTPLITGAGGRRPRVGVVVVADRSGRDVAGTTALLARDLPGVELFGVLAHDERGAAMFDGVDVLRPERTLLVRSGRTVVEALAGAVLPASVRVPVQGREEPPRERRLRRRGSARRTPDDSSLPTERT